MRTIKLIARDGCFTLQRSHKRSQFLFANDHFPRLVLDALSKFGDNIIDIAGGMLADADTDGDGKVSFKEFMSLMIIADDEE